MRTSSLRWTYVQAVTIAKFGPVMPYVIYRCPEIILMIVAGTKNGDTRRGPASPSVTSKSCSSVSRH